MSDFANPLDGRDPDCRGGLFAALWWCVVAWTLAVLAAAVVWRLTVWIAR